MYFIHLTFAIARHLNIQIESPAVYQKHIDEILKLEINTSDLVFETSVEDTSEKFGRTVASFSASNDFGEAEKIIKQHCEKEWPDDFKMRVYCQDQQHSALAELKRGAPADIPSDIFAKIRAKCASEWPDDYKMRLYCEQKQFDSYRKLKS